MSGQGTEDLNERGKVVYPGIKHLNDYGLCIRSGREDEGCWGNKSCIRIKT